MVFKKLVNIVQDTSNGAPFIVEVVPNYSVQDQVLNRIPDDTRLAAMIAEALKEEVVKAVRRFNSWSRDRILKNVKGYLIADNGDNSKSFTNSLALKKLDVENILFSFEHIQQSNISVTVHDLEWSFQIDPNTIQSGGTAPPVPPSWAPRKRYRNTWEEQMFNGCVINCAAFALTVLASDHQRFCRILEDAYDLQQKLGWGDDVDFGELSKIVEEWPRVKVVLLDGKTSTMKIHFTGDEYVFDGKKNIFYLYHYQDFKLGIKHYAACETPLIKNMCKRYDWCHACSVYYSRAKGHECEHFSVSEKKESCLRACKKCKIYGPHSCPLIQCRTCSMVYPRGNEIHRCAIELSDKRGEKSWFYGDGRPETSEADGKYTAILAYDLESVFEKVECSKMEIVETLMDDEYYFSENAFDSVTYGFFYERHVANLVYVMDVFTGQEWKFFGDDCLSDFIDFLFSYNDGNCQAWAHNGSGYDTRLIFEAVVKKMVNPSLISQIMSGSRFMQLKVDKLVFRDSLRHLPGSLKKLANDFCKDMMMKGDFPFMFNRKENYDYVGSIPSLDYYPVSHVKSDSDLSKLLNYHASWNGREDWNFKEQLVAYCRNDVLILADILKKYHQICFDFSEQSPLGFITGPGFVHSYCGNESFRQICRDCPPPEIEYVDGYRDWLNYIAKEKYWCVLSPYEHYFAAKSLRGGRTENRSFRCVLSEEDYSNGFRIGYTDVVSMYPSVQIDQQFPVGAPTIFVKDMKYWPCPDIHPLEFSCGCGIDVKRKMFYRYGVVYDLLEDVHELVRRHDFFGIVCCTIIPPKNLIHAYFMQRNEVMEKNIGSLLDEDHIEVVMTSLELKEMIQYGYQLVDVHCYHKYNKGNFWKEPTLKLYLEKMLNSCEAPSSDMAKEEFVRPWVEKYGEEFGDLIKASWSRWGKNPAKRAVAKTMMNSVWGKQAQRPVLPKNFLFSFKDSSEEIATYFRNCDSSARKHQSTVMVGDDYMLNTCIDLHAIPNLHGQYMPAACFVTAASRSKLYKEIWNLGRRALYMDTDSIIFKYQIGSSDYMPPEGSMVGEWETDGLIEKHGDIMEFVSFAPKTYGLKFRDGFTVVKAKGMSLSRATDRQFNYEIMKESVEDFLNDGSTKKIRVTQSGIAWCLKNGMKSVFNLKEIGIQPEHFKGIVKDGYIYPFGYDFGEMYE